MLLSILIIYLVLSFHKVVIQFRNALKVRFLHRLKQLILVNYTQTIEGGLAWSHTLQFAKWDIFLSIPRRRIIILRFFLFNVLLNIFNRNLTLRNIID